MAFSSHLQFFLHLRHFSLCLHPNVILSDPVFQLYLQRSATSPYRKLLFWLHYSSKSGMQGSVFQDLFYQHMPTILQFYGHFLLLAIPLTASIFPRNSAEATSVLHYLPEHEACSFTHLCKVMTAAFQSSLM